MQILEGYARITAPFDGVVTRGATITRGAFVRAASAENVEPIVTVVRSDIMVVVVDVLNNDVPVLDVGDPVTVQFDALKARGVFPGRITRTAYALEPKYGTLRARSSCRIPTAASGPVSSGASRSFWRSGKTCSVIPSLAIAAKLDSGDNTADSATGSRTGVRSRPGSSWVLAMADASRCSMASKGKATFIAIPDARLSDGQAVTIRREGTDRRPVD